MITKTTESISPKDTTQKMVRGLSARFLRMKQVRPLIIDEETASWKRQGVLSR